MRIQPNGTLIGGIAGSGVYVNNQRIRNAPAGTATGTDTRVVYQSSHNTLRSCTPSGEDDRLESPQGANSLVAGRTLWAAWLSGTGLFTSTGLSLPAAAPLAVGQDDALLVTLDRQAGIGVGCYVGASLVWSEPNATAAIRTLPQAFMLDTQRAIWADTAGTLYTHGLPAPAQVSAAFDPFLAVDPQGDVWVGYHTGDDRLLVHPLTDASKGYVLTTGITFDTTTNGAIVGWGVDASESEIQAVAIPWGAPLQSLGTTPAPIPIPEVAPWPRKLWVSTFFSYSLRPSIGITNDPFGNAHTLVGGESNPTMIGNEVLAFSELGHPLIVSGDNPDSQPEGNLDLTIAWWASGRDADALGVAVAVCAGRPEKPTIAYLDSGAVEAWPISRPAWVTEQVWPSVQAYRGVTEPLDAFRGRLMTLCERVTAYGRPFWLTLRMDDWNGQGSLRHTLEAMPVYEEMTRWFDVVGLHLFSDRRGQGMAHYPALRAWGKAFAAATPERPSRFDYWTPPGTSPDAVLIAKLSQTVACYSLTRGECDRLIQLLGGQTPPPPPPTDDVFTTLKTLRARLPALLTSHQCVDLLNRTAYVHRASGWGLLAKDGGNHGVRSDGQKCSVDWLVHRPSGTGHDCLKDAGHIDEGPGPSEPVWSDHGEPFDMTKFIAPIV